jgi:hypothetical protein
MYPRPSRETIAEQVKAQQPREPEPEQGEAARNFAVHLTARMRALGLTLKDVGEKAGCGNAGIGIALGNGGRCVSLDVAEKIAQAVGGYLAAMIGPYLCGTCHGEPHAGFRCLECGTEARAA